MADIRTALQKLNRGQALTDEEAAMIGYTQPTTPVATTPVSTRTGLSASDFGPGRIPVQAAPNYMDITSQRYTAGAIAAGETPVANGATGPINIPSSVPGVITNTNVNTNANTQQLPAGFTAGPFPKEFEKFFGAPGDILGYRINSETDKDGVTFYTLSVAQKGAYGEGVTGYSTFGARLMKDASGNWVSYMGKGSTTDSTTTNNSTSKTTYTAPDGRIFTDLNAYNAYIAKTAQEAKTRAGQSAFDLLKGQFAQYGLGGLVDAVSQYIKDGLSADELLLRLRDSEPYKKRFAANAQRVAKGLRALSEAEYILKEDAYQEKMRQYGLPESYYAKGEMGVQPGFEKLLAGDVSAAELEDRLQTAYDRVINANPEVSRALKQFYPDITNGDILAYALDPQQAITNIKRKVTAAEIGAGALVAGLQTDLAKAEALRGYGVTGEQAKQGYQTIAGVLPRASTLADIYAKQGMGPYTQTTAEAEVFGLPAAAEATTKRKKLTELEQAQFGGSSGRAQGALARERAGQF